MTDEQYSVEAYKQRRLAQRARVAQLVFVALLAGAVGASFGYLKGEVAVLTGESQVASVILAAAPNDAPTPSRPAGSEVPLPAPNPNRQNTQQQSACSVGGENVCLNKCSAVFVDVDAQGKPTIAKDCSRDSNSDETKLVRSLLQCIAQFGTPEQKKQNEDFLRANLCTVDKPKTNTTENSPVIEARDVLVETSLAAAGASLAPDQAPVPGASPERPVTPGAPSASPSRGGVSVPKSCESILKKILELPGKGSASKQTSPQCTINAVVCTKKKDDKEYTCVPKPEAAQSGDASAPKPEQSAIDKAKCIAKALASFDFAGVSKCNADGNSNGGGAGSGSGSGSGTGSGPGGSQQPQNGVTGGAGQGMPKPPAGGGSGSGSGSAAQQPPPQCPTGYTLSSQQPQTSSSTGETTGSDQYGQYYTPVVYQNRTYYCVPANTAQPECIFNASKNNPAKGEKIKLTWQTIGTANGRVMLSDGSNEGRIEASGEQEVTITSARTYTLTAYNAQGASKQCKVSITLGGTGEEGTAGAYPPKLSCAPSIIEKGKSATVTWECSNSAKKSAGEGTTTGGATTGKKTVTPEGNTEYTVSCFSSTDANIDDEEAETFLGKRTCSVRVAEPEFDIVAYPESASRGERVRISWGSLFMKSCKVTGPRGFDYTRPNGVVVTEPFSESEVTAPDRTIRAAVYTIVCESIFGKRYSADVTVDFEN